MPDISLCKNYMCPLAEQCYRFTAPPSEFRQVYHDFEPDDEGNCDHFIPVTDGVWYNDEE
jgi:hypothetical protein